jgi:hypothetical protein
MVGVSNFRHAQYDAQGVGIDDPQTSLSSVRQDPTTGALVGAGGLYGGPDVLAYPLNSDGIDAAIARVVASGKPGTVRYLAARYAVTRTHPVVSGVTHAGVPCQMTFGPFDQVPDFWTIPATGIPGTVLDVADGVTAFAYNSIDLGAVQSPLMNFAVKQVGFYGLAFRGGLRAIKIGAVNAMGVEDGFADLIYAYNQTCSDNGYAIDIQNTQFFRVGRIRVTNDVADAIGGNFRFACTLPQSVLLTGDSDIEHIFSRVISRTRKGVVLEADHPSTTLLNNVKINRTHSSRYTTSTPATVNVTTTNGSADISVLNSTEFALCVVGMPLRFQATAPSSFDANITYFVVSRNTGSSTVQLGEAEYSSAITPTSSGTFATYCAGFPTFIARAGTGSAVKNCNFGDLALEVTGNIGMCMFSKTRNCIAHLENPSTSFTGTGVICRDAEVGITYAGSDIVGADESGLMGGLCNFTNLAGGFFHHTSGNITLNSTWNGRRVRYSGTSDINVTIPRRLPPGFWIEFVPTGATGIITFTAAAGLGLWSRNGLRTNGQYAKATLRQISTLGYHLDGDLQV